MIDSQVSREMTRVQDMEKQRARAYAHQSLKNKMKTQNPRKQTA